MEFKSLKNMETSFWQVRTMGTVFVSLYVLVTGYTFWSSYRFVERQKEKIYVLDNGKSLILALSQDLSQDRLVEAKGHIRRFRELFLTLSLDKVAIESNIRRALSLCDESAFRYYKDREEKGYYDRVISANIDQSIRMDDVACDLDSYPYVVTTYARQLLVGLSNITERSLVARCRLLDSARLDNSPHGFTMEQFNIVGNWGSRTVER